jgi:uncharacterized protein (DUF2235 family)
VSKNIILCSDGTGNADIKGRGTNVFKLFEAVDLTEHRTNPSLDTQLAFYDDGVGTKGNVLVRWLGGAAGYGLKRNVKELYRELSRVYDPGDRIFLFGFSRGAFTVRTLSGMISACGVLNGGDFERAKDLRSAVDQAYGAYRAKYQSLMSGVVGAVARWPSPDVAVNEFRDRYSDRLHREVPIEFIGVWDTVDAVGMPFAIADVVNRLVYQFKFRAHDLGRSVKRACHALSIDDPRLAFAPVLWHGQDPRIDQVWFAGVHSNVGGGYPKQGMSLVALDWMLAEAQNAGLRTQRLDRELFRGHATVDDMMYDPRAGIGLFYRWGPRDIAKYCRDHGVRPRIHLSVAERIAHATDDYAPGNIPPDVVVVTTPVDADDPQRERKQFLLEKRAEAVGSALTRALQGHYKLDDVRGAIRLGQTSYVVFLIAWAALLASAGGVVRIAFTDGSPAIGRTAVSALWVASASFVFAWMLARWADGLIEDEFSAFWQKHQRSLRDALKHSKREAREDDMAHPASMGAAAFVADSHRSAAADGSPVV